ncbi:transposase [Candidatus Mesenet endosymbiont of Agriotes lineatus]|uniref:transposase n=1 Tax=Candidatus Mesenet endosymbiont of Agriotes lineatus TaxID=3077948 RepID=UPI003977275F
MISRSTKYRYRILVGETAVERLSENYVDIVSGNITPDHVHMLISMPPTIQQYIKGNVSYSKSLNN